MAGDEELRARASLDEMQLRISQGPYVALGISEYAGPDEVRSAFLGLTKQFHPARFGRMSSELLKLANEVFLGIKSAHDQLQKMLGGSATRPGIGAASSSQTIPIAAEGTAKTPAPQLVRRTGQIPPFDRTTGQVPALERTTGQVPRSHGTAPPLTQPHTQPLARGTDRPSQQQRAVTPPLNTPPHGMQRPATAGPAHRPSTPGATSRTTPTGGIPSQRPTTPVGARPGTPQPARPTTPSSRPSSSPPRPSADLNPGTVRGVQPAQAFDERSALRESMMLLNDRKWADARQTLHTLAAKVPQSKSYRALLCYARGREAHAAGRADEAQLEYQRALQLEPNLDLAAQAMAELSRRR